MQIEPSVADDPTPEIQPVPLDDNIPIPLESHEGSVAFREDALTRSLFLLALPVIGEKFLVMLVGWSDTFLTGQFLRDPEYIAAVTVAAYLVWLLECSTTLVSIGIHAVIARLIGGRELKQAGEVAMQSLYLAVIAGILIGGLSYVLVDPFTRLIIAGPKRELVVSFIKLVSLSTPFMMLTLTGTNALRGAGHTMPGMVVMAIVNFVNVMLSWAFCTGWGPFPKLGWLGIATGTSVGFVVGAAVAVTWLFAGFGNLKLPRRLTAIDSAAFHRILRIGAPAALNMLTVVGFQLWFLSIIDHVGTDAMAAHGVALRSESIAYLTAEAFSIAGATIVGQSLGARKPLLAIRAGWTAFGIGAITLSAMGVLFFFGAEHLFAIFVPTDQKGVWSLGVPVLRLITFAMPALAASIILSGALRGAGDTKGPLFYNTIGFCCVRIPLAYLLTSSWVGWGLFGAWTAMVLDLYTQGLLAFRRFRAARWTALRV